MKSKSRLRRWWLAFLGLAFLPTGCAYQTWVAGMTLPSPHYLDHPPQYFAPSPPFPHSKELAYQERVWAAQAGQPGAGAGGVQGGPGFQGGGAGGLGLPPQVPPVVGPGAMGGIR